MEKVFLEPVTGLAAFLLGLAIGSFLNVCIYRLPRRESVVFPGSHCPSCGKELAARDLVPILSYLWNRGRCRFCGGRISRQYPLVEALTGLAFLLLLRRYGLTPLTAILALLTSLLIVVSVTDLQKKLIPDAITIPGIVLGLLAGLAGSLSPLTKWGIGISHGQIPVLFGDFSIWTSLLGMVVGGGVLAGIAAVARGGMGVGDIKLLAMLGSFGGWRFALASLFGGALLGSVVGILFVLLRGRDPRAPIPFGPFLSLAAFLAFFC